MEKAVDEDLLEVGLKQLFGRESPVKIHAGERSQTGDSLALDKVHGEDLASGVTFDGEGDADELEAGEIPGEHDHIGCFTPVIQFVSESVPEFIEDF